MMYYSYFGRLENQNIKSKKIIDLSNRLGITNTFSVQCIYRFYTSNLYFNHRIFCLSDIYDSIQLIYKPVYVVLGNICMSKYYMYVVLSNDHIAKVFRHELVIVILFF